MSLCSGGTRSIIVQALTATARVTALAGLVAQAYFLINNRGAATVTGALGTSLAGAPIAAAVVSLVAFCHVVELGKLAFEACVSVSEAEVFDGVWDLGSSKEESEQGKGMNDERKTSTTDKANPKALNIRLFRKNSQESTRKVGMRFCGGSSRCGQSSHYPLGTDFLLQTTEEAVFQKSVFRYLVRPLPWLSPDHDLFGTTGKVG